MTKCHTQLAKMSFEGFFEITPDVSFLVCLYINHTTVVGTTLSLRKFKDRVGYSY